MGIADDHEIFRNALKVLIETSPEYKVIWETGAPGETIGTVEARGCDILILDMEFNSKYDGGYVIKELRKRPAFQELKILVLTISENEEYLRTAIGEGANGYILKKDTMNELLQALEALKADELYITASLPELKKRKTGTDKPLTPREIEVLRLLAGGLSSKQIAISLKVEKRTIDFHRYNLLHKTGLPNTAALINYAITHKIV